MAFNLNRKVFENKFENNIYTIIFGLSMGVAFISFIVWNRLIRERLPRIIDGEPFSLQFWLILVIFIYFFFRVMFKIYSFYKMWKKIKTQNKYVSKFIHYIKNKTIIINILSFFINYVVYSPVYLWRFLYFNVPKKYKHSLLSYVYIFGMFLAEDCFPANIKGFKKETITSIVLLYITTITVFSIFLYEIAINKELRYFYYSTILLLIPLILRALRRILYDFSYYELEALETDYFYILYEDDENQAFDTLQTIVSSINEENQPKSAYFVRTNYKISNEDYLIAEQSHSFFANILRMTHKFFIIGDKYDPVCYLITNILLMLAFFYWLLIIIKIF